jgi:polysaccharide export outer membrane protein
MHGTGGGETVRILGSLLRLPLVGSLIALGGCALIPSNGPDSWDLWAGQRDPKGLPYALVEVTSRVTGILAKTPPRLTGFFPTERSRPSDIRFGIGDIVSVTIFEASSGGLFIPSEAGVRPGNFINIPKQAVDINGNISIPYAGNIRARGRTPVEVQQAIVDALKSRAIEPQAVVSLDEQKTSLITVLGDVGRPGRIPAPATPERLLDIISRAGGANPPLLASGGTGGPSGSDMWVLLERNGRRELAPFGALIYEPPNNVYVHPNDIIYVYRDPQTFLAFGATGTQQQLPFQNYKLSMAEALARVGGLADALADPKAVFLYRGETREVAGALGIDCSKFEGPIIPVIYNFNLRNPATYFLATTFEMRNKDVIYAANAVTVEQTKFLNYLTTLNQSINNPISTAINVYALRNIAATPVGGANTAIITNQPTVIRGP